MLYIFLSPVEGVDLPFHSSSPSKEDRNDLYPLNNKTIIAIGYIKLESKLIEKAFDDNKIDIKTKAIEERDNNK